MQVVSGKIKDEMAGAINTTPSLTNPIFNRGENQMAPPRLAEFCSVEGCGRKHDAKGYCQKHYKRWRLWGDPNVEKRNYGKGDTPEQRFWSKVAITADPTRCWEWRGYVKPDGYGTLELQGKSIAAHRVAFYYAHHRHAELLVLHSCDNRRCVNPKHLREGTHAENTQDALDRGRWPLGENRPSAKLTNDLVREIKQRLADGEPKTRLAARFGIAESTVFSIAVGRTWRHVTL